MEDTELLNQLKLTTVILNNYYKNHIDGKLSKEVVDIIKNYTDSFYSELIAYMLSDSKGRIKDIELIQNAIKLSKTPIDLLLYRGTSKAWLRETTNITDEQFEASTFLSTTIDSKIAYDYKKDLLLKIYLPKGSNALWLRPLSVNRNESEILLPKGITFKISDTVDMNSYEIKTLSLIKNKH